MRRWEALLVLVAGFGYATIVTVLDLHGAIWPLLGIIVLSVYGAILFWRMS